MTDQAKAFRLNGSQDRGGQVTIFLDGQPIKAFAGETIAAALMAHGRWVCQSDNGRELGVFCNIGVCHSCLMTVNGIHGVRTCKTPVSEGCTVETRRFSPGRAEPLQDQAQPAGDED